jgi:hypothetical protein
MLDRDHALDLIERALDHEPLCPVCGAYAQIQDLDGHIYLVCSSAASPDRLTARIGAALLPHLHREIVDLTPDLAA